MFNSKTRADKLHKKHPTSNKVVDLNHIFLFLAVVSPLLVLARAWRPGVPYRGWRIAALVVLAITGIAWILFRVAALTVMGLVHVAQLVGASGCIMGIVGAWAGFLLRHRHAPHAKQRLANVVMIVAIQTAFDLSTPQVSMAAHLCGLIAGFFLGLMLASRAVPVVGSR